MASETPTRRPYHGSCHCGATKYVVYVTLPPSDLSPTAREGSTTRLRKCNCSTCHKTGFFHLRLIFPPTDFVLLSPIDPFSNTDGNPLADYQCFEKFSHWFFCKTCGVRCFTMGGDGGSENWGETVDINIEKWLGKTSEGKMTKVWRPKVEGPTGGDPPTAPWDEKYHTYFSVNAASLEPGQEGLSLKEWHEKGWINYLDLLDQKEEHRNGEPHRGGMY